MKDKSNKQLLSLTYKIGEVQKDLLTISSYSDTFVKIESKRYNLPLCIIGNNIFQWNDKYPSVDTFKDDIEKEHLYVLVSANDEILGCVSITYEMDDFYRKIDWISPTSKNIYVHRLAVHPNHQGQGYAQKIMK